MYIFFINTFKLKFIFCCLTQHRNIELRNKRLIKGILPRLLLGLMLTDQLFSRDSQLTQSPCSSSPSPPHCHARTYVNKQPSQGHRPSLPACPPPVLIQTRVASPTCTMKRTEKIKITYSLLTQHRNNTVPDWDWAEHLENGD